MRRRALCLLFITVLQAACAMGVTAYLDRAIGHATQDEVTQRLGAPHEAAAQPNGESVWTYRSQGYDGFNQESWCREHVLTFDAQHTLRKWTREDC
ncbi:MAG: hypothetical protein HY205_02440 [Nitrospirae bacterium]|nr:hypothetical protein [Nitrospirota bacterium]